MLVRGLWCLRVCTGYVRNGKSAEAALVSQGVIYLDPETDRCYSLAKLRRRRVGIESREADERRKSQDPRI